MEQTLASRLSAVRASVPPHVTLVAVSKKKPHTMIREAYELGQRDFGENYVQELADKQPQLPSDVRWHFIGHLQRNKVKQIAPFVHLIHGVDSLKLLEEIDKQGAKNGRVIRCLLQLHVASEETKFGMSLHECRGVFASGAIEKLRNVQVCGFMAMASNTDNEALVRSEFRSVREFRDSLNIAGLDVLSYGMSGDYRIAVEEGSTMVRIGSLIFGER